MSNFSSNSLTTNFLIEFYNLNKSNLLLSKQEIIKESKVSKFLKFISLNLDFKGVNPFEFINQLSLKEQEEIIFGFKSGLLLTNENFYLPSGYRARGSDLKLEIKFKYKGPFKINELLNIELFSREKSYISKTKVYFINYFDCDNLDNFTFEENEFILIKNLKKSYKEFLLQIEVKNEEEKRLKEKERKIKLNILQTSIINELDKDNNGQIDLVDGDSFNKLLNKNQKSIIDLDKNYVQKFVKISMYLKTKKSNTQKIFESITDTKDDEELMELVNLLKNQVHTYELLVFHSISMITSLVENDLIIFYEIYECFDQLNVFNSNWENEVSNKLTDIGDGIRDLMYSIFQMESRIVDSIDNLTYVTQESFSELSNSINSQLSSIDSSINFNNLLTGIQTYQMYKINQNTKGIN